MEIKYIVLISAVSVLIAIIAFLLSRVDWTLVAELRKASKRKKLEAKRIKLGLRQDKLREQKKLIQNEIEELGDS